MLHPVAINPAVLKLSRQYHRADRRLVEARRSPAEVARLMRGKAWCLRLMNSHLIGSGFEPDQVVEVDGHLYRAAGNGGHAAYIGPSLPDDTPIEAYAALDDIISRETERAEWASYYYGAVCPN